MASEEAGAAGGPKQPLTKRQQDAFTQRPGENSYAWVARTDRRLRARDLTQLLMLRHDDDKQRDAIQLLVQIRMVTWTRALAFGTLFLGLCTIVAAGIARS